MTKDYSEMAREILDAFSFESDVVRGWWYEECEPKLITLITKALEAVAKERDGDMDKLREENERLKDADVASGVLRMENKKIGGTLAEICKLLRDSGVEKKYFDQADNESLRLRLARMEEILKIISRGWHNQECNHGEVALKDLEEDSKEEK